MGTPSPESITLSVVFPETCRTVWVAMFMAGTLNVSIMNSVMCSR